jgi:penicillin-binding protein 2
VPLRFRLTEEERAKLAVNRFRLPGVWWKLSCFVTIRMGAVFPCLGYVGRINEQEAQELDETNYRGTFHVGKVGVEKFYEDILHGMSATKMWKQCARAGAARA